MMKDHIKHETNYKWITALKYILDNLGMSNIWISQRSPPPPRQMALATN